MADNEHAALWDFVRTMFREQMKGVFTALPGHVLSFDPATQLAQVQIGIQGNDNGGTAVVPTPVGDVPVFVYGGEYVAEVAIKAGCEGLIVFSQKCIDGWLNSGGVAPNPRVGRRFSMADAFFLPGVRSLPNAVSAHKNDGLRIRNKAGSQFVWLHESGDIEATNGAGYVRIGKDGTVTINGVTIDTAGNVTTPTTVTAKTVIGSTDVKFGGISGKGHVHPCGDHDTGVPK